MNKSEQEYMEFDQEVNTEAEWVKESDQNPIMQVKEDYRIAAVKIQTWL